MCWAVSGYPECVGCLEFQPMSSNNQTVQELGLGDILSTSVLVSTTIASLLSGCLHAWVSHYCL